MKLSKHKTLAATIAIVTFLIICFDLMNRYNSNGESTVVAQQSANKVTFASNVNKLDNSDNTQSTNKVYKAEKTKRSIGALKFANSSSSIKSALIANANLNAKTNLTAHSNVAPQAIKLEENKEENNSESNNKAKTVKDADTSSANNKSLEERKANSVLNPQAVFIENPLYAQVLRDKKIEIKINADAKSLYISGKGFRAIQYYNVFPIEGFTVANAYLTNLDMDKSPELIIELNKNPGNANPYPEKQLMVFTTFHRNNMDKVIDINYPAIIGKKGSFGNDSYYINSKKNLVWTYQLTAKGDVFQRVEMQLYDRGDKKHFKVLNKVKMYRN